MLCKHPEECCCNMTFYNGKIYCDNTEGFCHLHDEFPPYTQADRIRSMTNEELADFFFESPEIEFEVCEYCKNFGGRMSDTPCKHDMGLCYVADKNEAFKKWLQQPCKD